MATAPALLRGQFGDHFGSSMLPVLEEIFSSEVMKHAVVRDRIFAMKSTDRDIVQSSEIHDLPLFKEMSEGEEYSFEKSLQGANKTMSIVKYGLGFSISDEMIEDGKFDFIGDSVRKLAKSAMETQEVTAMNVFNNGFGSQTTADGVALFSAAHTLPSGLIFRNKLSTDADLDVTSLKQMISDFETQFIGDTGIKYRPVPNVLLVHSSNRLEAMELIKSSLLPGTADNNMNSIAGEGLQVISSPHLTDTDAWYLLASPEETGLRIYQRRAISTKSEPVFINDSFRYKSSYREVIDTIHAYGVFGSQGA